MKKAALNSNQLKLIAIAAMTLDHLVWTICPGYSRVWWVLLAHIIGRLTAPNMWYFVAEGYHYTHDVKKYAGRLFLLALISHFAYNFCFGISFIPLQDSVFNQTSVAWSLAWGLVLLCVNNSDKLKSWQKTVVILLVCVITFPSDWSCIASMAILYIGTYRGNFRKQMLWMMFWTFLYALVYFFFIDRVYAGSAGPLPDHSAAAAVQRRARLLEGHGQAVLRLLSRPPGRLRHSAHRSVGRWLRHRRREFLTHKKTALPGVQAFDSLKQPAGRNHYSVFPISANFSSRERRLTSNSRFRASE